MLTFALDADTNGIANVLLQLLSRCRFQRKKVTSGTGGHEGDFERLVIDGAVNLDGFARTENLYGVRPEHTSPPAGFILGNSAGEGNVD